MFLNGYYAGRDGKPVEVKDAAGVLGNPPLNPAECGLPVPWKSIGNQPTFPLVAP